MHCACERSNCSSFAVRSASHRSCRFGLKRSPQGGGYKQPKRLPCNDSSGSLRVTNLTSNPMTTRLATAVLIALLLALGLPLAAQEHPRTQQQPQSQQLPQTRTGAPQAAMTHASMADVSDGLKRFISGYAAKSPDNKFHMPYQRKDLALELVKLHDERLSNLGGDKY